VSEPVDQLGSREIRLAIPAEMRFLRAARLTAAGIAGDLGFGLQAIEDLRVAIDEMCAVLIAGAPASSELELVYQFVPGELTIEGRCHGSTGEPSIHPVAAELLRMTADEFTVSGDGDGRSFRLVKRQHDLSA
jgi:serine/threonine-protein kinase RsbW